MRAHAVVVAYGEPAGLEHCVRQLTPSIPVTIVDNSSSPAVREIASSSGADYLDAGSNRGFAAAVNLGVRAIASRAPDAVLLINPDATLAPEGLERLQVCLEDAVRTRVAAVAPRLIGADGAEQRVAWPFPTPWRAWLEAVGLGRRCRGEEFVVGAVLLIGWQALSEVGAFDERYFLYAEEADWFRRALDFGWQSRVCPDAFAHHVGAGSSVDEIRREALFHAAQETYVRKWHGAGGWCLYRAGVVAGALARTVLLRGARRNAAGRRAVLYLRGPRKVAGLR